MLTEGAIDRITEAIARTVLLVPGEDSFWIFVGMIAGAVEKGMPADSDSHTLATLLRKTPKWGDAGALQARHLLNVLKYTLARETL